MRRSMPACPLPPLGIMPCMILSGSGQGIAQQCPERGESPVRSAAPPDNGLRRKPAEAGGAGLAGAGRLNAPPTTARQCMLTCTRGAEDAGRATSLPQQRRPTAPARGWYGYRGPRRGSATRAQAWRAQVARPLTGRASLRDVPRGWRKVHLTVDEATLQIRAAKITGSGVGGAPVLPDLLGRVSTAEEIGSVTALSIDHASHDPAGQWTAPTTPAPAATPSPVGAPTRSPRCLNQWRIRLASSRAQSQAVEEGQPRGGRKECGLAGDQASRADHLAALERIPPSKLCRNEAFRDIAAQCPNRCPAESCEA